MPAHQVYEWLRNNATKDRDKFYLSDIQDVCRALLVRGDPLIDLGLARFGTGGGILRELFHRVDSALPEERKNGLALRLAVLSNEIGLGENMIGSCGDPVRMFFDGDNAACVKWLNDISFQESDRKLGDQTNQIFPCFPEIQALFENASMGARFLTAFLKGEEPWNQVDEIKHRAAVLALGQNKRACAEYKGHGDSLDENFHRETLDTCWMLAEQVPVSMAWAAALGELYKYLPRKSYSSKDSLEVAKRWVLSTDDDSAAKDEVDSNKYGYLGHFQSVRMWLGCRAISNQWKEKNIDDALTSEDITLRCAAYRCMSLSEAQIKSAYERDKNFAVNYMLNNPDIWRNTDNHFTLWAICNADASQDHFYARRRMKTLNPEWFQNENDQSNEPVTKADITHALEQMQSESGLTVALDLLRKSVESVNSRLGWVFWFSLGALVASYKHF